MAVSVDGVRRTRRYQCAAQTLEEVPGFTGPLSAHHPGFVLFFIDAERLIFCLKEYLALFFQGVGQDCM